MGSIVDRLSAGQAALPGQEFANETAGRFAVVSRHVEMGNCSDHEGPKGGDLNAALGSSGGDRRCRTSRRY